ncbi:MAG: hypothetical protein OXG83_15560 [Acidobacteria bacterium]|nr:hypothetical protein [Acidobacteriota bacterium]
MRQLHVCEEALERVRAVRIEVKLEAPNPDYVSLFTPPSRRVDGVHPEEEVIPPRVQVAKPGLIALAGHTAGFYDPLKNRRPLGGRATDGENGDVLDRLKERADVGSG